MAGQRPRGAADRRGSGKACLGTGNHLLSDPVAESTRPDVEELEQHSRFAYTAAERHGLRKCPADLLRPREQ